MTMKPRLFAAIVLAAVLIGACSGSSKPKLTPTPIEPTATVGATATATVKSSATLPTVTRTIAACPVEREICDFALQAETWVRNGDVRSLIAPGSGWDNPGELAMVLGSIQGALPVVARPARLASIGCPLVNGAGDCSGAFSLTFTTLTSHERDYRGVLTLGFLRRPGAMPALSAVGGPDGDDRFKATETGGTSAGCGISGATPKTETDCIRTVFNVVTVERTTPRGSPPDCPLLPTLCDFALKTEASLATKDYTAVGGAEMSAPLGESVTSVLGNAKPRLVGIACPFGPTQVWCTGPFALGFTTIDPSADWTTTGGIVVLQFEQDTSPPRLAKVTPVTEAAARQALLFGDIAAGMCDLAGRSPATPPGSGPCSGPALFERYWSSEPFPSQQVSGAVVLTPGAPEPPPPGTALYVVTGCWQCDGPAESLQRHVVDATGKLTTTTLLENGKGPLSGWTIGEITATPDGRLFAAKVCDYAYCGGMGNEVPLATHRVIWSADGGVTWTEAWRGRVYRAYIESSTSSGLVVEYITGAPGAYTQEYVVVTRSGSRRLPRPAQLDFRAMPLLLDDGHVIWVPMTEDGLLVGPLLAEDGTPLPLRLPAGASSVRGGALPGGRLWLSWSRSSPGGGWLGVFDPAGTMYASYRLEGIFRVTLTSESFGIGSMMNPGTSGTPLFLDLYKPAPRVQPIGAPFGEPPLTGRNQLVAYVRGPLARVNTGADCLNVREQPSTTSTILTCLHDGVLVDLRPNPPTDPSPRDYASWQLVELPDGRLGWVHKEYLER
jgi:Bacterial SH3 domain